MARIGYTIDMKTCLFLLLIVVIVLAAALKLMTRKATDPNQRFAEYQQVLVQLEQAYPNPLSEEDHAAAMERFGRLWSDLSGEQVRAHARSIYAEDVWFNDTVKTLRGGEAVADYLQHTADRVDACTVTFDQVMRAGADTFVRWTMVVLTTGSREEDGMVSCGITHMRFNEQGQVVLHQDFWDPAGGLYEHIPGVRWVIQQVRARL